MNLNVLLFISLNVLMALAGGECFEMKDILARRLYNSVIFGEYNDAVAQSIEFEKNGRGAAISEALNRLIENNKGNTIEYAYQLWNNDGKDVVKFYFPIQFRIIINGEFVKFINKRDYKAMKLEWNPDEINDRGAFGDIEDTTSDRMKWKFIAFWDSNKLYFKILNMKHNQYLKLATGTDNVGDRRAWGSDNADTHRHQWYLQPAKLGKDVLFFIYNREYNQPLKLGRDVDSDGDRIVWGHNGFVADNPGHYGWFIEPH